MAVTDHIRLASGELLKAADLMKTEINDLRRQESQTRHDLENAISQLTIQLQHNEADLKRSDDPQHTNSLQASVALIVKQIADRRSEIREMERNIRNAIDQKSRMVVQLESQARSISP